jgi:signal transduction histidine kinase
LERFDLNELLASLVSLYSSDERLKIKWTRPATPDYIYADKMQVNRLFTNLIKNGIEASEETDQPEIILEQYHKDGNIIVSVTDKGTGISPEMQPKIFTPNFTTKSSGTGLGLAICKGIVEKAKGEIWFETREGEGTTFFVLLPIVE